MSDFDEQFDDDDTRDESETPEEAVERLRDEIAEGEIHLKPELAEALMHAARNTAEQENYEDALKQVNEALAIGSELVEDGQIEFEASIGRCLLFRAAVIRLAQGSEPALIAFNEAIRHFSEHPEIDDPDSQNELAVALVNKADLLIDPLGAHSAAIAAQEQAVRIWQQLIDDGQSQYRRPLCAVLLNCGDAKLQSGDPEKALQDYRESARVARAILEDGLDEGETDSRGILIQALMKQARLHEIVGEIPQAFETSAEMVRLAEELVDANDAGNHSLMLTPLYLQYGLLYEKIGDTRSALELFDRCRDVYLRVLDGESLGEPGDYIIRTGLANVMMCRGNMLADQRRYDEAAEAFDESVRIYRESAESRPEIDDDETFLPYSIAVVRLNHANMLASQQKLAEAVAMKEESLDALRNRYENGHEEILPNLISAYRKMIGIHRVLDDVEKTGYWIEQLIRLVDAAVDEGRLEYRSDLGIAYHMQSVFHEEQDNPAEAEKALIRAVNLFRQLADEASDSQDVQMAKLQWGELLERLALMYARQKRIDDALEMFRKAVDDVQMLYGEGARHMIFDVLLAYTQMLVFIDVLLRESAENQTKDDLARWGRTGLDAAETAAELSQRQRIQLGDDIATSMFFTMKLAFFRQIRGSLFASLETYEKADKEYTSAIDYWRSLLEDLKHLRNRQKYFEREAGIEEKPDGEAAEDPYQDRYLYYVGELRATLNRRAQCRIAQKEFAAAERDFENDTELARELWRNGIPDADRFVVLSLTNHARGTEDSSPFDEVAGLYEEARTLVRSRFRRGEFVDDDFFMLRHIHVSYALFMLKNKRVDQSIDLIQDYSSELEAVQRFPEPGLWIELCKALEIHAFWHLDADRIREVHECQRRFLARHPDFETNTDLQEYDAALQTKIEHPELPEPKKDEGEKSPPIK